MRLRIADCGCGTGFPACHGPAGKPVPHGIADRGSKAGLIGTLWVVWCCSLGGCSTPKAVTRTCSKDCQVSVDARSPGRAPVQLATVHENPSEGGQGPEVVEETWPGGNLQSRREVKRDEEGNLISHGVTTEWWEDGAKKSEVHFKDGVRHGPRVVWYQNGQEWSQGAYEHGKPVGRWTVLDSSGSVERQWHYDRDGAYHGLFTLWHSNGLKRMEVEWVRGRQQGFETHWDDSGDIRLEINYGR